MRPETLAQARAIRQRIAETNQRALRASFLDWSFWTALHRPKHRAKAVVTYDRELQTTDP